jgi:hypothetical protein
MKVPTIICPKCDGEIDALAFQEWGHGRHPVDCPVAPFICVAGEVDALRVKIAGRAQTDPLATLVMASLDRAHAAAMFAARCDGCKK